MNKIKTHTLLIGILALFQLLVGCTTTSRTLKFNPLTESKIIYSKDSPYLISEKKHQVVLAIMNPTLSNELGNLPCLYLQVKNSGAAAIDIGLDNVTATSAGKPVSFFSASGIAKAIKKQAAVQAFAVALGAGLQQAGAAMQANTPSYSTTYGSANVYNPYKAPTTVNYTAHTTTYNPAAASAAQAQASAAINSQMQSNLASVMNQKQSALNSNIDIFGRNTIAPQTSAAGRLIFLGKQIIEDKMTINITFDGETHQFDLLVEEIKN